MNELVLQKLKIAKGALNGDLAIVLCGPAGGLLFPQIFNFILQKRLRERMLYYMHYIQGGKS